jgi:energy-coupling factor transporter ATP-binding protein EcfA2
VDATLDRLVFERLVTKPPELKGADDLVLAACSGRAAVEEVLAGRPLPGQARPASVTPGAAAHGVWLESLEVAGFRGVGPRTRLSINPRPGLTLIIGRNGSGKSSFAEALEFLLTGTNYRWNERSKVWSLGWRNLHQPESAIVASFTRDGEKEPVVIAAAWQMAGELVDARRTVAEPPAQTFTGLGWSEALVSYRPFLSYNELGSAFDQGPTKLYDALVGILGLEDLARAQQLLREARLTRQTLQKEAAERLPPLLQRLAAIDDKRAKVCLRALSGRRWDLDVVELALSGAIEGGDVEGELNRLRLLATLSGPEAERVMYTTVQLRAAAEVMERVAGTDSGRAKRTVKLLKDALTFHKHAGDGDCPVCHNRDALNATWRVTAEAEIEQLTKMAADADQAEATAKAAYAAARALAVPVPVVLRQTTDLGIDASDLADTWQQFSRLPADDDLDIVAQHLEALSPSLNEAIAGLRKAAASQLERREDAWRPIAHDLTIWLDGARRAVEQESMVPALKAAEAWLKEAITLIRDQRFAPIADGVAANWRTLRQASNVNIGHLTLQGTGSQRHVEMDIDVDGQPGTALAVMSQGELNCLALSLFLPRAMLPESPFRFVVIDDPVQSMDPAKVDGLARVLTDAARDRQVIVFSHDDRLPQALWRLDLPATVLEVTRRENSVVQIRQIRDVVHRYLDDARAVASDQNLPVRASSVVPGFCRSALEEACAQLLWRRRLAQGRRHDEVEEEMGRVSTITMWLALALFDDVEKGGEVFTSLNRRLGPAAGDTLARLKRGAHEPDAGDLRELVRHTEKLAAFVGEQK